MTVNLEAQAQFFRKVEGAFGDLSAAAAEYAAALEIASGTEVIDASSLIESPEVRGPRQKEIIELLTRQGGEDGLKTWTIATHTGMEQPNVYTTLQGLAKQSIVEMVPGVDPQHWRLAPRFRLSRKILEVAELVREGEWTSYGDISQVVYGHAKGGLAVGRVASTVPDFPNPHRVLLFTGQIPAEWVDAEGRGPEHCASLLRREGVSVDNELFAHGRHHVTHIELSKRLLL